MSSDEYINEVEAAYRWGCSPDDVSEWCRKGKIPGSIQNHPKGPWCIPSNATKPEDEKFSDTNRKQFASLSRIKIWSYVIFFVILMTIFVSVSVATSGKPQALFLMLFGMLFWITCVVKYKSKTVGTPELDAWEEEHINWTWSETGGCLFIFTWPLFFFSWIVKGFYITIKCIRVAPYCYEYFIQDTPKGKCIVAMIPLIVTVLLGWYICK